jgi:type VI secretion system ImpA family protein
MTLRSDIFNAIPGDNPAGPSLRHTPIWEKTAEALREEMDLDPGIWIRPRKLADLTSVIELSTEAIAAHSKDLQLAAWLTEALLRRDGIPGLTSGLDVCRGLLDGFWAFLHPNYDEDDPEETQLARQQILSRLADRSAHWLQFVPICGDGRPIWDLKEFRRQEDQQRVDVRKEAELRTKTMILRRLQDLAAAESRQLAQYLIEHARLQEDGRALVIPLAVAFPVSAPQVTESVDRSLREAFDKAVAETPAQFYRDLRRTIDCAMAGVNQIENVCGDKFQSSPPPSFAVVNTALSELAEEVGLILRGKQ